MSGNITYPSTTSTPEMDPVVAGFIYQRALLHAYGLIPYPWRSPPAASRAAAPGREDEERD